MTLLGTGFGYSARRRTAQAALVARMLPLVRDVRRIGSAALDLCMVAAGGWMRSTSTACSRGTARRMPHRRRSGARVVSPAPDVRGAGITVAAAPGIAEELLAVLARFGGLDPIEVTVSNCWRGSWPAVRDPRARWRRTQRRQGGVDVVAVGQRGEFGAEDQIDGVIRSAVMKQLSTRRHQPDGGRGRLSGGAEPNLALAGEPGARIDRVVGGGRLGEAQILERTGDIGGLPAASAGVEDADPGVGELCRSDVGHPVRVTIRRGWGAVASAGSGGGLHVAASRTSDFRVSAAVQTAAVAANKRIRTTIAGRGLRRRKGRPCLSKAVPSVICATTQAL